MPLNIPDSAKEVESRSKADVQRELKQSNPFLKNSWLGAIVTASANRIFDFYGQLQAAITQNFPDTATGEYLTRWAAIWGKSIRPATQASGRAVATGTVGSSVPVDTLMSVEGVGDYRCTSTTVISDQTINIESLTRDGTTVTAVTSSPHLIANGVTVTIAGATDPEYDVTTTVVVTGDSEFQYEIIGSPANEPTTSATASFTTGSVPVESVEFGQALNLDEGTPMRLQSPLTGVDDTLTVDFGAVGGGTDQETPDSLRSRMLDKIQNPVAHFNVAAITEKAKEVPGVTRVFIQEITPDLGQVTIYFMRDNDDNPIPTSSEVATVKESILTIKPANTSDDDVIVLAPTGVPVDFVFTELTPNTTTMQAAVSANLRQFFDEQTEVAVAVDEDAYRSAIFNTIDTVTGELVRTFELSEPAGDIAVSTGEIGILGTVTFP